MATPTTELPTITAFRMMHQDRHLHFEADDDLGARLRLGGVTDVSAGASYVLVSLDLDGEPVDVVRVEAISDLMDAEAIDRAVAVLTATRQALTS